MAVGRRVLVVGGGAREHALCAGLAMCPDVTALYVAPGNGGTSSCSTNVPILATDAEALVSFALSESVDLAIVGPAHAAAAGVADALAAACIATVGASAAAARIEVSKAFCKEVLESAGVPTPRGRTFKHPADALAFCVAQELPLVIKTADALGPNTTTSVCHTYGEVRAAVYRAAPWGKILVEEFVRGEEVCLSFLADGSDALALPLSVDYKRRFDGNSGPNTGGMGSHTAGDAKSALWHAGTLLSRLVRPVLLEMQRRHSPLRGPALMNVVMSEDGPIVLEVNARFGDTEAQLLVPAVRDSLDEVLLATAEGGILDVPLTIDGSAAVCVALVTDGYPERPSSEQLISGLEGPFPDSVSIFHGATERRPTGVYTTGGRAITVRATASTVQLAREGCYQAVAGITFEGVSYRRDIGLRA